MDDLKTDNGACSPCDTRNCGGESWALVHWPGRSLRMCKRCAERARVIADVMGFDLTVQEVGKA